MNQKVFVPVAIVIAGALIAGALFFAGRSAAPDQGGNGGGQVKDVPALGSNEHILGNPEADILIVEYSDIECPFCKQFHVTMQQIIDEYGPSGEVAWVYRHFPLQQIHPNAPRIAEASECVAELGGNAQFWSFIDEVFAVAPGNERFPLNQLTATAQKVGIDGTSFDECLASGRHQKTIETQFNDALASGGNGTPHNVIVIQSTGENIPLPGAQPYATVKNIIDSILAQ